MDCSRAAMHLHSSSDKNAIEGKSAPILASDTGAVALEASSAMRAQSRRLTGAFFLFMGGYIALLAWFRLVDVYHAHFSETGILLLGNTIFRILFIFYLIWIAVGAGTFLIKADKSPGIHPNDAAELLTLTFFAGAGLLQVAVFAIGNAPVLNSATMMLLTLPLVAVSFPRARMAGRVLREGFHAQKMTRDRYVFIGSLFIGLAWLVLLIVKGLYPGGSQDYYVHYFPAYRAFVEHGSLLPNELWWDYFFVKGAGLFFLGILLTDPLAPQTVIFCTCSVAGLVIFLLAYRLAPGTRWPIAGTLLFFAILIYTPRWGEFGKLHEFNTVFVSGILWMTAALLEADAPRARTWITAITATQVAAIVANLPIGVFLAILFVFIAVIRLCARDRHGCLIFLAEAGIAMALVVLMMLVNYATTGLPTDLGLSYAAKFADVEQLYRSGALPMLILVSPALSYTGVPFSKSLDFLQFVLRCNLLWPMILGGLFTVLAAWLGALVPQSKLKLAALRLRIARTVEPAAVQVLGAALASLALVTVIEGRGISPSYYRFTTFALPIMILAGIAMWTAPLRAAASSRLAVLIRHPAAPVPVLALCAAAVVHATHLERVAVPLFGNALKHALGMLSIDAAFQLQSSGMAAMPARAEASAAVANNIAYRDHDPLGGTYPGARGAYAVVGPGTPIWSLHRNSFCMLPDCIMMREPYFVMTPAWDRVLWGSPEEARSLLRRTGINYFLFSRELTIHDPLPLSPLFSPDHIGDYLGIRWTDGITSLLTWSGPDTTRLDAAWIEEYRRSVATSPDLRAFPDAEVRAIFARLNATPHPWRSIKLPLLGQKSPLENSASQQ
jgi:hypothetical protein